MNKRKKHTFDDWWEGRVLLATTSYKFQEKSHPTNPNNKKVTPPIVVYYYDILEHEIPKIKEKQKELFDQKCNDILEAWKESFLKIYERSKFNPLLLQDQIDDMGDLLKGHVVLLDKGPNGVGRIDLRRSKWHFTADELYLLRKYYKVFIYDCHEKEYDFIYSPNCTYQKENNLPPQIHAQVISDYYDWMEGLQKKEDENIVGNVKSNERNEPPGVSSCQEETPLALDINLWNSKCFKLFNYLAENYNDVGTIMKFTNIWFYLRSTDEDGIEFRSSLKNYKEYISSTFEINLISAKMNRPTNYDNEARKIKDHSIAYRDKLKSQQ